MTVANLGASQKLLIKWRVVMNRSAGTCDTHSQVSRV
jgi:hypothetical protein